MSNTPEYRIWRGIIARCNNRNVKAYKYYGGRGITVCSAWRSDFAKFLHDVGKRPSTKHTIERVDVDGNYELSNCFWATYLEQANNKRSTRYVTYHGKHMSLCNAVREAGSIIHYEAAAVRIFQCGWSVEDAVETPSRRIAYAGKNKGFEDAKAKEIAL